MVKMESISQSIQIFMHFTVGIITILNPIAAATIMLSLMTPNITEDDVKTTSRKTSFTVLISSLIIVLLGDMTLKFFGINVYSVKIIGGIVLLLISISMIQGKFVEKTRHSASEKKEAIEKEDISVIPLAIPILVGPGTMATLLVFRIKAASITDLFLLILSIFFSSVVVYVTLRNAVILTRFLGITGLKIITRVMGLIVGAIGSQFIVSGIKALWHIY